MNRRVWCLLLTFTLFLFGLAVQATLAQEEITVKPKGGGPGIPPGTPPPPHSHRGEGGFKWTGEHSGLLGPSKAGKFRDDLWNQLCQLDVTVQRADDQKERMPADKVEFTMGEDVWSVKKGDDGKYNWKFPNHPQKPCLGTDKDCEHSPGKFSGVPPELMNADDMKKGSIKAWSGDSELTNVIEVHMKGVKCDLPAGAPPRK